MSAITPYLLLIHFYSLNESRVVFLNVQMAVLAQLFTGTSFDDRVQKLLHVDLSLEALVAMDGDGDVRFCSVFL